MYRNPFSDAELARRLAAARAMMAAQDVDVAVFSVPESVFYLTGLDHWGYFAPHYLIVAQQGQPVLITRAMEAVTIRNQLRDIEFDGHSDEDGDGAALRLAARLATFARRTGGAITGIEMRGAGMSVADFAHVEASVPGMRFVDISPLSPRLRRIKSDEEIAYTRAAARVSSAGMAAAVAGIADGVAEVEVAAEVQAAMTRAGGAPPGFGPFLRPLARLGEEHATWGDGRYRKGEPVFIELTGCVARYHAPMGRLVHPGGISEADARMAGVTNAAFDAVCAALRPGARARDVYAAWQGVVDDAGLAQYRRHHCGYIVGIALPPSWTGGNAVTGLRHDSEMEIEMGMAFHVLSWLTHTGQGSFFRSDCVLLGSGGAEILTDGPLGPIVV